jgi:GT2 family glycosyltransferase
MIPVLSIPVLNRYDLLDKNLELIDFPIKEILIINNGKEDYNPKRKDLNVRVLNLPSNLGMAGSWNLTIKLYPHEKFWLFSSADTHWNSDPKLFEKYTETAYKNEEYLKLKRSQDFQIMGSWDIDRRRDQEWLL